MQWILLGQSAMCDGVGFHCSRDCCSPYHHQPLMMEALKTNSDTADHSRRLHCNYWIVFEFLCYNKCNFICLSGTVGIILSRTQIFSGCIIFWIKCALWWIIVAHLPNPISKEWKCWRNSKALYFHTQVHKNLFWVR